MTVSARMRYKIFTRDNFTCQYCGQNAADDETIKLEIEHIMPQSKGGTDAFNNLVTSCFKCNRGKHADTPILFTANHVKSKEEIKPIKQVEIKNQKTKYSDLTTEELAEYVRLGILDCNDNLLVDFCQYKDFHELLEKTGLTPVKGIKILEYCLDKVRHKNPVGVV